MLHTRRLLPLASVLATALVAHAVTARAGEPGFDEARRHAAQFETAVRASRAVLHAWLQHADPKTLLLPDRPDADARAGSTPRTTPARTCTRT
jgi:hypothetical protein